MKIIAVIPARKGSKGIPNKNIRLLSGKPLIYYSIKTALESRFINEVIVTTDSKEIEIIAKQLGVRVKQREEKLCRDDIPLDPVIYNAIRETTGDYVVTLQPTSPLLTVKTLDNAIDYAIKCGLDSVISVINKPHLAWKNSMEGKKIPAYEKRVNRQYLPPYFIETGAFVISKFSMVKENSRFGTAVDVFEIPEEESIDIDSFSDFKNCEFILNRKTVAFYVNGNNKRGIGHVYRCLELADEFYVKPDIYFDINQTDKKVFGTTTHNLIGINGIQELFELLKKKKYDIFINDILNTTIDYMIALKNCNPTKKIINFEDDGEGIHNADLVINSLYQTPLVEQMKTGKEYYVCAKTFLFYKPIKIAETVKNVFICFGGADPQNYTDRLLNIIKNGKFNGYNFIVALGRAKENIDELLKYNNHENIKVFYDVENMPELMSQCDIAITSRGRTAYELAILGIPTIAVAQNAREEKHGFVIEENGFKYLGLNPDDKEIEFYLELFIHMKKDDRMKIQEKLLSHDLANGRKRVFNLIDNL
jgi:CMP-N-acetylneuraminic acid synthetase